MKQYNLALSRRGASSPILRSDHAQSGDAADFINMFDLDFLGTPSSSQDNHSSQQSLPNTEENQAATNLLRELNERGMSGQVSSSGTSIEAVSGKRGGDPVSGAPAKKTKPAQHSGSQLPGTSGNTDGMVGGRGDVPEGSVAIQNISRGLKSFNHTFTFQKRWKFLTFGVADQIISDTSETNVPYDRWALTTSLASIPWEYAFFYISPAEWVRLRQFQGVFAKHAHIKISQYNPRVAFQTADTTSTTATLNQNKFTRYGVGLRQNAALTCSDRDYEFSTAKPMQPTGFAPTTHASRREKLKNCMYGVYSQNIDAMNSNIPAYATGQELGLSDYLTVYAPKSQDVGFVPYDQFCHELNSMDLIGQCMLEQDYSFEYAPLMPKWPAVMVQNMQDTNEREVILPEGTKVTGLTTRTLSAAGNATLPTFQIDNNVQFLQSASSLIDTNVNDSTFTNEEIMYFKFPMEQNGAYHELNRKPTDYAHQQSVHVGIRPVPKLSTNANLTQADDWLDTQIYWTIEAELHVEANDPFTYIRGGPKINPAQMQICETVTAGTVTTPRIMSNDFSYTYGRRRLVENNVDP